MKSMTGYGQTEAQTPWGRLEIAISSVNHRYQDMAVRVPRDLASLEQEILKELRKKTFRGKMQLRLAFFWNVEQQIVPIAEDVLGGYFAQIKQIQNKFHMIDDVQVDALLHLPGVLQQDSRIDSRVLEELSPLILGEVEKAFGAWEENRALEGEHLREDMEKNLREAADFVAEIETSWEKIREGIYPGLKERLEGFLQDKLAGDALDQARIVQEAAMLAEKQDIAEELCRFRSHEVKFASLMESGEPVGRKIEFLLQEINREVNTIASKCNDSDLRWYVVEIKSRLERIREQVQNVE